MSHLHFQETFTGTASQTTDIVLAGESSNAPMAPDHTLEVGCNLTGVVSYSGAYVAANYAVGQPAASYPTVTIDIDKLKLAASPIDTVFRDKDSADMMPAPNAAAPSLQGVFRNETWSFNTTLCPISAANPLEAVLSVTYGAITATTFDAAVAGGSWGPSNVSNNPAVNLFEQCLAAGKLTGATLSDADGSGAATFANGDSINIYVEYTLTKTRSYTADSDVSPAVTGGNATITVGGVTVGATPVEEVAASVVKRICWKFVHDSAL